MQPRSVALAALVLGFAFRLRIVALPLETLTSRYLADDYFYYLGVAHGIAHGHGSSADGGLTHTNGYQPLFLFVLVAFFTLGASKTVALRLGLLVQSLALSGAGLGAYGLAASNGARWGGALAAGLLSLDLFFVLPSLAGFETALALATLLGALWCWHTQRPPWLTGLACGLAVLARVDCLVLPALLGACLLWQRRWRDLAHFACAATAVLAPWALWSTWRFGSPAPDSGALKAHFRGLHAVAINALTALRALPRIVLPARLADRATAGPAATALLLLAIALLTGIALRARHRRNLVVIFTMLGLTGAYLVLTDPGEPGALVRYLYPAWALALVLLAGRDRPRLGALVVAILALHVADLAQYVRWERGAPVPLTYVRAAQELAPEALARVTGPNDLVAAFDSGALAYFAPRPVVNLDGLVNHEIVELERSCRERYRVCLRRYLRRRGVTVLAGGTAFGWTRVFPDWSSWERLYESPPLLDGSQVVLLRLPRVP